MTQFILHHYGLSPFSEKIRRLFAYKKLEWHAVEQPIFAPKPDLAPLTGGYRRIPVMQIGADIYCDTALIVDVIERQAPTPSCIPATLHGVIKVIEDWADRRLFMQAVPPTIVALLDTLPPEFFIDRAAMSAGFTRDALAASAPHARAQLMQSLDRLNSQFVKSAYIVGDSFTVADAACYHPVWFMKNNPELFAEVAKRSALAAWQQRIENFPDQGMCVMSPAKALDIAAMASPVDTAGGCEADLTLKMDDTVSIVADDYGHEQTTGRLVRLTKNEVVVVCENQRVNEVAVHYPRTGYRITKQ